MGLTFIKMYGSLLLVIFQGEMSNGQCIQAMISAGSLYGSHISIFLHVAKPDQIVSAYNMPEERVD